MFTDIHAHGLLYHSEWKISLSIVEMGKMPISKQFSLLIYILLELRCRSKNQSKTKLLLAQQITAIQKQPIHHIHV